MTLCCKFRYEGTLYTRFDVKVGDRIDRKAVESAELETPGTVVTVEGPELEQAMRIVTNNRTRYAPRQTMVFVGDEARKILLNWW